MPPLEPFPHRPGNRHSAQPTAEQRAVKVTAPRHQQLVADRQIQEVATGMAGIVGTVDLDARQSGCPQARQPVLQVQAAADLAPPAIDIGVRQHWQPPAPPHQADGLFGRELVALDIGRAVAPDPHPEGLVIAADKARLQQGRGDVGASDGGAPARYLDQPPPLDSQAEIGQTGQHLPGPLPARPLRPGQHTL